MNSVIRTNTSRKIYAAEENTASKIFRCVVIDEAVFFSGSFIFFMKAKNFSASGSMITRPEIINILPKIFMGVMSPGSTSRKVDSTGEIIIVMTTSDAKINDVFNGLTYL